jgi:uncharacterized protein with PhoU and TrkA domain
MELISLEFRELLSLATAACSFFAAATVLFNKRKIQELHVQINARMDQLLTATAEAALAAGRKAEKADRMATEALACVHDFQKHEQK